MLCEKVAVELTSLIGLGFVRCWEKVVASLLRECVLFYVG